MLLSVDDLVAQAESNQTSMETAAKTTAVWARMAHCQLVAVAKVLLQDLRFSPLTDVTIFT
jgi:hypothetical protein